MKNNSKNNMSTDRIAKVVNEHCERSILLKMLEEDCQDKSVN